MRFLLVLTALMLAVAAGVWWKTTRADDSALDPLAPDPSLGAVTFGAQPESKPPAPAKQPAATPANLPAKEAAPPQPAAAPLGEAGPADATAPGSGRLPAGGGDPREPQTPANERPKPAEPPPAPLQHVVKDGENLYRIVLKAYGTAPEALVDAVARANGLRDAGTISPGQTLTLPSLAGWPPPKRP